MKILLTILSIFYSAYLQAQTTIKGTLTDHKGEAIAGANIYLKDTYDGTSSDLHGDFRFQTEEKGTQILVISAVGYEGQAQTIIINGEAISFNLVLQESINKMNGVTITAGTFGAGDQGKAVVLEPLDIVTTASAIGDIAGALQTLPGTQTVGEDGRLFIRGGESYETKIYIDGVLTHTPFNAKVPNLPTRGRFSPFLFKGTTFSTGGYSAEYGQALSSALILSTTDFPEQHQTDFSIMSVGVDAAHQHRWEKAAVAVKGEYINLSPYQRLIKQPLDWEEAPKSAGGSLVFRKKLSNTGLIKTYSNYTQSSFALYQPNIDDPIHPNYVGLRNNNLYLNTSYQDILSNKWSVRSGIGYTYDDNHLKLGQHPLRQKQTGLHAKATFTLDASARAAIHMGTEYMHNSYKRQANGDLSSDQTVSQEVEGEISSTFVEADFYLSPRWVTRTGMRVEYISRNTQLTLAPRLSLAYQTGNNSQISLAYGKFYQTPEAEFLFITPDLAQEQATHYILNYQHVKAGKTFRAEAFYKQYDQLVKTEAHLASSISYNNKGTGYARGVDLFWRDQQLINNGDFWLSYSFLDTERNYHDFPYAVVPGFASRHNFSAIAKYFITPLRTQAGFSYSFASGRPYYNPNHTRFHTDRTLAYHDMSLNAAHLIEQNIILYAAVTNTLGVKQIFGYEYSSRPNEQGIYQRRAIGPAAPRFFFIGLFITLTKDKQANQLDNL